MIAMPDLLAVLGFLAGLAVGLSAWVRAKGRFETVVNRNTTARQQLEKKLGELDSQIRQRDKILESINAELSFSRRSASVLSDDLLAQARKLRAERDILAVALEGERAHARRRFRGRVVCFSKERTSGLLYGPFELRIGFKDENVRLTASRMIRGTAGTQRKGYVWYSEPIKVTFEIVTRRDSGLVVEAVNVELLPEGADTEVEPDELAPRPRRSRTGEASGIEPDWWRDQGDPP